jgi:hypothetical protein
VGLKARIARLEAQPSGNDPHQPLVVVCKRVGDGEDRPPGVYYNEDGGSPTVVFEGGEPPSEVLARFRPETGPGPLIIIHGLRVVPRPSEFPGEPEQPNRAAGEDRAEP